MTFDDAVTSVERFVESSLGRALDEDQIDELVRRLVEVIKINGAISPDAVAVQANLLFGEDDMKYGARSEIKVTQQSESEITQVVNYFLSHLYFDRVCPFAAPPVVIVNGQPQVGSKVNLMVFNSAVSSLAAEGKIIRHDTLADMSVRLWNEGLLERKPEPPQVVVKTVEAPQPDARDLHNKQVALERAMNDPNAATIRGRDKAQRTPKPPAMSEEQKQALNARNEQRVQIALVQVRIAVPLRKTNRYSHMSSP